jgi:hypothetical protein
MPRKSVTIPLTMRQKQQIKKATGKTVSAVKVENAGPLRGVRLMQTTKRLGKGPIPMPDPS